MIFKSLIFLSLSCLMACTASKSSKPVPEPAPIPSIKPTSSDPIPDLSPIITREDLKKFAGDWQADLSDIEYVGNVTYSIRPEGAVLLTLMVKRHGSSAIQVERQVFQGALENSRLILQRSKSSCGLPIPNAPLSLTAERKRGAPDTLTLAETGTPLTLQQLPQGLTLDVHTVTAAKSYPVEEGCFTNGRLDQFVPL